MSSQRELNSYIQQLHQRLRLGTSARGIAILAAAALLTTIVIVLILNAFAFPQHSLAGARWSLLLILFVTGILCLALPLLRLNCNRSIAAAESAHPEFQQRLLTFHEREQRGEDDPFIELLAADTLNVAQDAAPSTLVPDGRLFALAGAGFGCIAVLVWMIAAGPGFLGYGASLLWTGPKHDVAPLYDIQVTPGDVAVRRNSDQLITARVIGLHPDKVQLYARYQGSAAKQSSPQGSQNLSAADGWEPVTMQPQPASTSTFQFLFAGLPQNVEYYVKAGPIASRHFRVRVVDLPAVQQIHVTYHYPKWTAMPPVTEERGGDLRAIEGTDAELEVVMDHPLTAGSLTMDDGQQLHLAGGEGNRYKGTIHMQKDGAYHVSAVDQGQPVRLSEDYFIATSKANPPQVAIDRPTGDYRASPIEEVNIGIKANDEFALNSFNLHYSVNGGADHAVNLLKQPGTKSANGSMVLSLEDFKLVPGDLVSLYATARDGHSESRTEISFIQADPFEREFSQSQQSGGGGGGGGGSQGNQTDISKREKELIAATWKQQNDKAATPKENADTGKFLSEVQAKLREQVLALSGRMQSRDLSAANEEFNSFERDMQGAAAAMQPSSEKLSRLQWSDALPVEQKALQYLLRAEATFRQIQVAFGQQRGGGGGGGGNAGRDLASLFDLELDTQKNQYETAQTSSPAEQRAKDIDDALQKLDALARRQQDLAQQQRNSAQSFQDRWQQEMLRREAEQLQRQLEQMTQDGQQGGQQSASSGQSSSSQSQSQRSGLGSSQSPSQSANSQSSRPQQPQPGAADPRVEQALNRLRQADQQMKRATGQQQSTDAARAAADQLREASGLLGGAQQQQASGKLDSLSREADRLSREERSQADRVRSLAAPPDTSNSQSADSLQAQMSARMQDRNRLAEDRQRLSDDLSRLERGLRDTARELAATQPGVSSKLRDALSGMDQEDLGNRVQRTADWLRRGINPNSNGTEGDIGTGLQKLGDQVRQARQSLGPGKPSQAQSLGEQTAALDHLERLRGQIESMSPGGRNQNGRNTTGRPSDQSGQQGQRQQGRQPGQQGQSSQQRGQGQGQGGQGQGLGSSRGDAQGRDFGDGARGSDIGNASPHGGGGDGTAWGNVNTGNNRFDHTGPRVVSPGNPEAPPSSERAYRDGLTELNHLRQLAHSDPAALAEVQDLIRQMQRLDPSRFPGNPALVEQLHTQVLSGVDKLELELRRDLGSQQGPVRTGKPSAVPPGYQDAVADYYRRLGKGQ